MPHARVLLRHAHQICSTCVSRETCPVTDGAGDHCHDPGRCATGTRPAGRSFATSAPADRWGRGRGRGRATGSQRPAAARDPRHRPQWPAVPGSPDPRARRRSCSRRRPERSAACRDRPAARWPDARPRPLDPRPPARRRCGEARRRDPAEPRALDQAKPLWRLPRWRSAYRQGTG